MPSPAHTSVNDIRSAFLDFFQRNGHEVRPSGSLVPHNDPTLMFANAGMNQFKNVFTGAEKLPFTRAATSQKCVRAGGKHNDLDNVGYTARHHTFFEMLGNFSFGDYFKETAIELAWTLLTKDYGINPEKLCVTVYHTDDAAFDLWKKLTGFPDHKIIRIPTSDNFWTMGDTGPCGPCSEIFYDHGDHIPGGPPGSPEQDGDRFVEIWNLVFMQYEQLAGGERIALPKPSIDTGMGLERISAVMQGVSDNYDIDLFRRLIAASQQESGNHSPESRISHRVIADHLRSSGFLIADGVLPSNEGRGYVLRRIMRRAMRHAHQLGCKEPLMYRLVPALVAEMGGQYPELKRAEASIIDNLRQEEERFKQTLERGLKLLDDETAKIAVGQKLSGDAAFKLYDTYGFPLDLTQDILRTRGLEVDTDGFETAMEGQRDMARAAWSGSGEKAVGKLWFTLKDAVGASEFVGYEADACDSVVLALVKNGESVQQAQAGDEVLVVLKQTPFYGESGGQMGDTGTFSSGGKTLAAITDTMKPIDDFIIHKATLAAGLNVGNKLHAAIDAERRDRIRANHSATHLLHKALRDTLGEHVTQKGSLVAADRLRFDISHPKPVTREQLDAAERKVNQIIWHNTPVTCNVMSPDEAIKAGAMALFGEKYGDKVRVLAMGRDNDTAYSTELCGGTHVNATGDIGLFKIISETAVAAGVRRIEAVTRGDAFAYLSGQEATVRELSASLKVAPADLASRVDQLSAERKKLDKELAEAKKQLALGGSGGAAEVQKEMIGGTGFIGKLFDGLDPKELRGIAESYLAQAEPGVVAVGTSVEGKASLVVAVSKALTGTLSAVTLVQAAVAELGGKGGGGRPEMAQGGGPEAGKLESALTAIRELMAN
jgi:alanyl-tRNA synthetase